jgi:hypothetical protein
MHAQTDMLASMGFAFEGCFSLVVLASLFLTAIWCLFIGGLCWTCTRPWTAFVCIFLAILGNAAIETEEPISVVIWAIFAFAVGYVWWRWGTYLAKDGPRRDPEKESLLQKQKV